MEKLKQLWGHCPQEAFFRKKFKLEELPQSAVLRIFVDTGYELFLNGRLVAAVNEWNNIRDYDVRLFLKKGRNVIAVHGINSAGHRGFAFELFLNQEYSVFSDESWKAADSEKWGWMLPEYDDSRWDEPAVLPLDCAGAPQWTTAPGNDAAAIVSPIRNTPFFVSEVPKCIPSPFFTQEPVRFEPSPEITGLIPEYAENQKHSPGELVYAKRIVEPQAQSGTLEITGLAVTATAPEVREGPSFCLDFGEECCGYFRMRVKSDAVTRFRIVYGETLDECFNEPEPETLLYRMLIETGSLQPGVQEWESRIRGGFRFVRVEFLHCPAPVAADGFQVRSSLYGAAYRGYFSCSDPLLNKIWRAGRKTLHLCMQEYYLDGIKRDRLLWVGDIRTEALCNYYLFFDRELFRFSMRSIAECQYHDGAVGSAWGVGASLLWDYIAWWMIAMHDYYLYTGDGEFYLEMKPHLCQAADWLIARAGDSGLIDIPANPLNVWMVVLDGAGGTDPYMNELFRRSVRVAVEVCRLAGDDERSAGYSAFLEKLDPAVDGLLARQPLTGKKSLYQHSMGIFEVIETLFSEGKPHEALQLLRNAWEKLLSRGADTLYEGLYGDYPDITVRHPDRKAGHVSYCHGWTAGPCCLLASEIAGIKPAEPGFRRFTVAPRPAGLTSFEVVVPTPLGEIALLLKDGRYTLLVPEGAEAAVSLDGRQFRLNAGIHTF